MRSSRLLASAAVLAALATFLACERKEDGYRTGSKGRSGDASWLVKAAVASQTEIEASRLAQAKSTSNEIRQFADHMIEDHTKVNGDAADLAKKKGISLPTSLDEEHRKAVASLAEYTGAEFDKKFSGMMVTDHEKAVSLFESHGDSSDADVKAFVDKTLPTLKHHLEMARDLKGKIGTPKAD